MSWPFARLRIHNCVMIEMCNRLSFLCDFGIKFMSIGPFQEVFNINILDRRSHILFVFTLVIGMPVFYNSTEFCALTVFADTKNRWINFTEKVQSIVCIDAYNIIINSQRANDRIRSHGAGNYFQYNGSWEKIQGRSWSGLIFAGLELQLAARTCNGRSK